MIQLKMQKGKRIRSKIIHSKVFVQRAMGYIAILNSGMILFLFLSNLENYKIDIKLEVWFIPIFIMTVIFLIFLGYLEDKWGFFSEESRVQSARNPYLSEINERLDRIEKILKK